MELALFFLLAIVVVVSATMMIVSRNSIHSALYLILNFGCVALLFLMLDAPFISMVQIAVYAGAIMVLFLFVIMLLGAEQTTDTEARRLVQLPSFATGLALLLLVVLAAGLLLSGGLDLPEPAGEAPRLRIIHAANVQDPVRVSLNGEEVFTEVYFGENSDFAQVPAGETSVTVTDANGVTVLETSLDLANEEIVSLVAYGDGTVETAVINQSLATTAEGEDRLYFLNLYSAEPIVLVDLGADRSLNTEIKEGATVISDRVLLADVPYGEVTGKPDSETLTALSLADGEYRLGFYRQRPDGSWVEVSGLANPESGFWQVDGGREQMVILSPDYNGAADPTMGYFPVVLDSSQEHLALESNQPFGSPKDIGRDLFVAYLLPVNLVGFLLLVALVGVIVLTRPEMLTGTRRSSVNRRRKVSRPLVNVISQQTGQDVLVDTPKLEDPSSGD